MPRLACLSVALLALLLLCSGGGGPAPVGGAPQLFKPFIDLLRLPVSSVAASSLPLESSAVSHLEHQLSALTQLASLLGLPLNSTDTAMNGGVVP